MKYRSIILAALLLLLPLSTAFSQKNAIFIGKSNVARVTTDGGKTWLNINGTSASNVAGISQKTAFKTDQKAIFIKNGVKRTENGGRNWSVEYPSEKAKPSTAEIGCVSIDEIIQLTSARESTLYAYSLNGQLLLSSSDCSTLNRLPSGFYWIVTGRSIYKLFKN